MEMKEKERKVGIRRIKNLWVHPAKIEAFYQRFMGSLLPSSVETAFQRNDLREVHIIIDEETSQSGEIRHGGGRLKGEPK